MLEARTACAIVLLLAPTGVAAAGTMGTIEAPAQHTAYVQIVVDSEEERGDLVSVEARIACMDQPAIQEAIDWLRDRSGCTTPPGAAVYVTRASAPSPMEASLVPTGTVYAYEDEDRVWTVREYTYAGLQGTSHTAYVLAPDVADRVNDDGPGEPVRGVVDLEQLGAEPGERVRLGASLGPAPERSPADPTVERVDADETAPLPSGSSGFRG